MAFAVAAYGPAKHPSRRPWRRFATSLSLADRRVSETSLLPFPSLESLLRLVLALHLVSSAGGAGWGEVRMNAVGRTTVLPRIAEVVASFNASRVRPRRSTSLTRVVPSRYAARSCRGVTVFDRSRDAVNVSRTYRKERERDGATAKDRGRAAQDRGGDTPASRPSMTSLPLSLSYSTAWRELSVSRQQYARRNIVLRTYFALSRRSSTRLLGSDSSLLSVVLSLSRARARSKFHRGCKHECELGLVNYNLTEG